MAFSTVVPVVLLMAMGGLLHQTVAANEEDISQIVVSPEDVFVYQGQTVLVPCVAFIHNTSTPSSITWMKDGVIIDDDTRITAHAPVESDVGGVMFVRVVLEVCDVRVGDNGRYSCELSISGVKKDEAEFDITVTTYDVPAQILVSPEDIEIPENKTVILSCLVHAFPSPTIRWSQNGLPLEPTSDSVTATTIRSQEIVKSGVRMVRSTLEVCNVEQLVGGEYECVADNGLSNSTASFTLTREAPVQLLSGPSHTSVLVGESLSLTCEFKSSPLPSVTWSGVPLTSGGRFKVQETVVRNEGVEFVRSVLKMTPVADYDEGEVKCKASNGRDELEHAFDLNVIVQPQILISPASVHDTVNSTITMACVAHTASNIVWYNGNTEITSDNDRVTITTRSEISRGGRVFVSSVIEVCGVGVEDSGEYRCVAEGVSASFDVCIIEPTGLLVAPSDIGIENNHTLCMSCVGYTTLSNAHPTTISWTRDNQPLVNTSKVTTFESQEERGGILIIRAILLVDCVKPEDSDQYACHVMSDDVIKSSEFSVTVQVPPRIKEPPDHAHIVGKGGTTSLVCIAGGDPLPTITWLKDSSPLDPDLNKRVDVRETSVPGFDEFELARESVLTIRSVVESDAGVYECQALNEAGLTTMEIPYTLIVNASLSVPGGLGVEATGHLSYLGTIVGLVCFLVVFAVYISIRCVAFVRGGLELKDFRLKIAGKEMPFVELRTLANM